MIKKISLFACTALALLAANEFSNRRAPSFSLPDVSMMQHDILDSRGKVLILEFMQTKCEKCQMLTKMMESKIKPKYGANISIISVVVPPDNFDDVKKYIGVFKVTSPIVFDTLAMTGE